MEQFKETIFTRNLNVFNETFAGLGSRKKYATIWHEATAGRNDEDIASSYYSFIKANRDAETITIWADNCTAQNKNWTLYTMLTFLVNSPSIAACKDDHCSVFLAWPSAIRIWQQTRCTQKSSPR